MTIPERRMRKYRYPAVNRCIYCPSDGDGLGFHTEHIIPGGLGGRLELPKASCHNCEKETHAFEGRVIGGIYGNSRAHLGVRREKRSKIKWPSTLPISVTDDSGTTELEIPIESHPDLLRTIKWVPPEILAGLTPDDSGIIGAVMDGTTSGPGFLQKLAKIGPGKKIALTEKNRVDVDDFARLLAKIGYAFAVAERGLAYFKPFVLNAIRNKRPMYLSQYVGMTSVSGSPTPDVHELDIREHKIDGRNLLIVRIHLFADIGVAYPDGSIKSMPAYDVVVGSVI